MCTDYNYRPLFSLSNEQWNGNRFTSFRTNSASFNIFLCLSISCSVDVISDVTCIFFSQLRQHFCSTCKYYLKKRNFYHIQLLISYANVFTVYCLCQINRMLFSHFYLYILVFATLNKKYQPFILTYFMWIKSLPCARCVKRSLLMNYSHWITETE